MINSLFPSIAWPHSTRRSCGPLSKVISIPVMLTGELGKYIAGNNPAPTPLALSLSFEGINRLKPWNLLVNATVETEV